MAKMSKGNNRASASVQTNARATAKAKAKVREPSPDGYLDTDSEVDEFANGYQSASGSESGSDDEMMDYGGDGVELDAEDEDQEEGNAKWEPDEWDEDASEGSASSGSGSESDEDDEDDDQVQLKKLQSDLGSLPLSTLAKAQKSLGKQRSSSSSAGSSSSQGQSKEERLLAVKAKLAQLQKGKGKAINVVPSYGGSAVNGQDGGSGSEGEDSDDDSDAPESASTKRGNKHAPQAMSTKRQVTRHRQVVDLHKPDRRDPRFSSVSAGTLDAHLHSQSYSFLPSILKEELSSLKQALFAAQKAERTCPWAEKAARTAERERIELQLGKVRTRLVRSERETAERDVLAKAKKEEREKRASGKGAWYMKKGEKRDLLLKARFQALEKTGGKNAVKKAMEKKRRKVAIKEKKSRPFAKGDPAAGGAGGSGSGGGGGGQRQRQRA